ncbi:MAG: FAD/NAD(P)-binding protein [Deltaproteobacteria bacterium]|nr:FAD/NAD(P)-binding protein [Deltaproteobacteria bacterium]
MRFEVCDLSIIGFGITSALFLISFLTGLKQKSCLNAKRLRIVIIDPRTDNVVFDPYSSHYETTANFNLAIGSLAFTNPYPKEYEDCLLTNTPYETMPFGLELPNWLKEKGHPSYPNNLIPRSLYGEFIISKLIQLLRESTNLVVEFVKGEVVDLQTYVHSEDEKNIGLNLIIKTAQGIRITRAQQVIVSIGCRSNPQKFPRCTNSPRFFPSALEMNLEHIEQDAVRKAKNNQNLEFLIAGFGYSTIDALKVLERLAEKLRKHNQIPSFHYTIVGKPFVQLDYSSQRLQSIFDELIRELQKTILTSRSDQFNQQLVTFLNKIQAEFDTIQIFFDVLVNLIMSSDHQSLSDEDIKRIIYVLRSQNITIPTWLKLLEVGTLTLINGRVNELETYPEGEGIVGSIKLEQGRIIRPFDYFISCTGYSQCGVIETFATSPSTNGTFREFRGLEPESELIQNCFDKGILLNFPEEDSPSTDALYYKNSTLYVGLEYEPSLHLLGACSASSNNSTLSLLGIHAQNLANKILRFLSV